MKEKICVASWNSNMALQVAFQSQSVTVTRITRELQSSGCNPLWSRLHPPDPSFIRTPPPPIWRRFISVATEAPPHLSLHPLMGRGRETSCMFGKSREYYRTRPPEDVLVSAKLSTGEPLLAKSSDEVSILWIVNQSNNLWCFLTQNLFYKIWLHIMTSKSSHNNFWKIKSSFSVTPV